MLEINHVCSLGSSCHSSQLLKRNNYKVCSYPFDWIFSNFETITHCLKDNFETFLDKSYYINISRKKCGHSKYHSQMWWHHNPLINTKHYSYYMRCVERFKDLLTKQEHKLFTMIFLNINYNNIEANIDYSIIDDIIEFNRKFSEYTSNYTLLVILHIPFRLLKNYHKFTYCGNIHFIELYTLSGSCGVKFSNENDNVYLDNIINSNYDFNIKN